MLLAQVRPRHPCFIRPNTLKVWQQQQTETYPTTSFMAAGFVLLACFVMTCIFAVSMILCLPVSLCCALGEAALLLQLLNNTCSCSLVLQLVHTQVPDCCDAVCRLQNWYCDPAANGWGVSGVSAFGSNVRFAMSQVFRRAKSGKSTNSKAHTSHTDDPLSDKTNSAVPEEDSPKIAAVNEKDEKDNVASVQ